MNMLNVVLVPLRETQIDRTMLFDLYKRSFFAFVDQSFGWDEALQQTRFHVNYPDEAIFIVLADGQFAGYISRKFREDSLHLALIMLEPAYQRQGIGRKIMQMVTHEASASNSRVTLSCFLGNTRALRFYRELGFVIVSEEPWFANLERVHE